MHLIRKLRESDRATAEQFAALLDGNVVMHSPLLSKAILSRDAVAKTMAASSPNRDTPGDYVLERKLDDDTTLLRRKGMIDGYGFRELRTAHRRTRRQAQATYRRLSPIRCTQFFRDRQRVAVGDSVAADSWDYL